MKMFPGILAVLVGVCGPALAGARQDVRIDTDKDAKRNIVYKLVNSGERPILAKVEHRKTCASVSTEHEPKPRTYLVNPGKPVQLRKVWSDSHCEHDFRILEAAYYVQP